MLDSNSWRQIALVTRMKCFQQHQCKWFPIKKFWSNMTVSISMVLVARKNRKKIILTYLIFDLVDVRGSACISACILYAESDSEVRFGDFKGCTQGSNFWFSKIYEGGSHVMYMHADSLLIHPNFSSKWMVTWLINCSNFHFWSTFISSISLKADQKFPNKLSHMIIYLEEKFGWINCDAYTSRDYLLHILCWIKSWTPA